MPCNIRLDPASFRVSSFCWICAKVSLSYSKQQLMTSATQEGKNSAGVSEYNCNCPLGSAGKWLHLRSWRGCLWTSMYVLFTSAFGLRCHISRCHYRLMCYRNLRAVLMFYSIVVPLLSLHGALSNLCLTEAVPVYP